MCRNLGWEPIQGENHLSSMMREVVLVALVNFGHARTIDKAMKRFQEYLGDQSTTLLPVDCRKVNINRLRHSFCSHFKC